MKSDFELMNELAKQTDYLHELTERESNALKISISSGVVSLIFFSEPAEK